MVVGSVVPHGPASALVSLDDELSSLEPQAVSPRTHTLLATTSLMIVDRLRIGSS